MIFVWFILIIATYAAIGAFLSGFFDGGDDLAIWVLVWPLIGVFALVMAFIELIAALGEYMSDLLEEYRDQLS